MAKVIRARVYGFCMGVRRAMESARREAEGAAARGSRAFTLGPLIHNQAALDQLAARGVGVLDEGALPGSFDGAAVVIRAHGVPPALAATVVARGGRLVDATCPRVRISQKKASQYSDEGRVLFLAGESDHGEVVGIAAYAQDCRIVSDPDEALAKARGLSSERPGGVRTALIGQTTIKRSEYDAVAAALRSVFPDIAIFDSICPATSDRQAALAELCAQVDAVVVVGGKNSANTKRLFASALEAGKPAWHVESASELPREAFSYAVVGLSAGASTPDDVIDAVQEALERSPRPIPLDSDS